MQLVNSWATDDRRTLLHFSDQCLAVFMQHVQSEDRDREAGGILLGSVHGSHLLIEQATPPTDRDRRHRHLFERMSSGHAVLAATLWAQSQGTIRYLGEWHTHPEDFPSPSGTDRSEWVHLVRRRKDGRALLAVIIGRKGLHVELVAEHAAGITLRPMGRSC